MNIRDDRDIEHELRVSTGRAKDVAVAGSLMLVHMAMFIVIAVAVFALSCIGSYAVLDYFNVADARGLLAFLIALAFAVVAMVMYARQMTINRPIAAKKVDSRLCRACGYAMDGLTIEPDGCRVCPECGAAWRASTSGGDA